MMYRYQYVSNYDLADRTYANDSLEVAEVKAAVRKAKYLVILPSGEITAGGDCYGFEGKAVKGAKVFRLRDPEGELFSVFFGCDPCTKYRAEYLKNGGKIEDLIG